LLSTKKNKIIATRHDFGAQNVSKNALAAGAPPKTPLGELAALPPDSLAGFGGCFAAGNGWKREGWETGGRQAEGREGKVDGRREGGRTGRGKKEERELA